MKTRVEIPPPGTRTCAARDCWKLARPNGWFCSDACRARTWRQRNPDYTPPPGESARQNGAERRNARVSNGGLQVSFEKAVRALMGYPTFCGERSAREALSNALSERQRARLEAKS